MGMCGDLDRFFRGKGSVTCHLEDRAALSRGGGVQHVFQNLAFARLVAIQIDAGVPGTVKKAEQDQGGSSGH